MELKKKLSPERKTETRQEQQNLQSIKNLHQLTENENKSASELFDSISTRIHALAGAKMSEAESREAARRLISFCQLIIDYKIKRNMQLEKEEKCKDKLENHVTNSAADTATKNSDVFCEKDR